tara:strand:- start:6593 stop:8434 length:1842 start_codon:yes stop_codon:yes gene_type:complete
MCGFLVYLPLNEKKFFNKSKFIQSSKFILHRGPDDSDQYLSNDLKMIFYRLSIIDTSNLGRQPMLSYSKRYIIVFNGEIYNAQTLKPLINQKNLIGNSDTEILINLYEKFGKKILSKLEGMFSFFIYDFKKKEGLFVRDRFGIKPLYYFKDKNYILLSSEIKPILNYCDNNNFNHKAFADFLIKQKMDHEEITFFKNIYSLEPSNYAKIKQGKIIKKKYWKIEDSPNRLSFLDNKKKYLDLFEHSVEKHLISDRKIGLLFSAGTDSTMLATIMKRKLNYPIQTYTYDFLDNNFGDSYKSKLLSRKLNIINKLAIVKPLDVVNELDKVCFELESPFTSIRILGMRKALQLIKKDKLAVVFEGGGGDEILGGYDYNVIFYYLDQIKKKKTNVNNFIDDILKQKKIHKIFNYLITITNQFGSIKDCTPFVNIENFSKDFLDEYLDEKFFSEEEFPKKINNLQKSQYTDIKFVNLPRSLKYTDRLSMNRGLENRVPFLDHHLAKFCFNLTNQDKIKNRITRYISKEALKKYKTKGFFDKQKKTITDPQSQWLRTSLKDFIFDTFSSQDFRNVGIFNQNNVKKNFEFFLKNPQQTSFDIFQIFTTFKFYHLFKKNFNC